MQYKKIQAVWPPGSADMVCPRPPLTLTFDHLILKLVCESHLRWETFLPNLGTLGFWVLKLFAMYATDGQTDRQTDKSNAYYPLPYGRGGHNNLQSARSIKELVIGAIRQAETRKKLLSGILVRVELHEQTL